MKKTLDDDDANILFGFSFVFIGMLGSLSIAVGLFFSPVITSICRKKSTRLLAVIGGLVTTLGCLFSSFALQFHQLFFSYGEFMTFESFSFRYFFRN